LPYENVCIYSDKPTKCYWKGNNLHNDNGKAVEYADGWGWYVLNGVVMKEEYVTTPADRIKPESILAEENVDMRRELIRKVGVEKMMSYGKIIEESNGYKLLDMAKLFRGIPYAPFLLMRNPSVADTSHLEGVSPECHTIEQAINWRAGNISIQWTPEQLS